MFPLASKLGLYFIERRKITKTNAPDYFGKNQLPDKKTQLNTTVEEDRLVNAGDTAVLRVVHNALAQSHDLSEVYLFYIYTGIIGILDTTKD